MVDELDLSGLEDWSDDELIETLNEIESGLSDNQITLIERFDEALANYGELSSRQREVAEDILRQVNTKRTRSIEY
jgi:hypothetical protein